MPRTTQSVLQTALVLLQRGTLTLIALLSLFVVWEAPTFKAQVMSRLDVIIGNQSAQTVQQSKTISDMMVLTEREEALENWRRMVDSIGVPSMTVRMEGLEKRIRDLEVEVKDLKNKNQH